MKHFLRIAAFFAIFAFASVAQAANRVWVLGSGNWSDTAHWSLTSGGSGGQTVPGSGDSVTIDGNAGGLNGGTLTIDQDISVASFNWLAAVGTIDNSANHNFTASVATNAFNGGGSSARTFIGGSGTYTLSAAGALWTMTTITGLTNPTTAFASATIIFTGNSSTTSHFFGGGGLTYGNVTFNGQSSQGGVTISGANTFVALTIHAPNWVQFPQSVTQTVTSLVANDGSCSSPMYFESSVSPAQATISDASGTNTLVGVSLRGMAFTGGATWAANESSDYGRNSGITITAPTCGGGGGGHIIGG